MKQLHNFSTFKSMFCSSYEIKYENFRTEYKILNFKCRVNVKQEFNIISKKTRDFNQNIFNKEH